MQSSKKILTHSAGKACHRLVKLLALAVLATTAIAAQTKQRSFSDRLLLDVVSQALVPSDQPTGLGGGLGFGYEFRDFNLILKGAGMIAEPGLNQRTIINPTLRVEVRIGLLPSFLTLLPYVDAGSISTRVRRPANAGEGREVMSLYAAAGLGAEILITHELSLIPRLGVAHALLYADNDSNNFSGPTIELALRYTFGRNRGLDY